MDEEKIKKIEEEGKKLIEEFSKALEKISKKIDTNEMTWYVQDIYNVIRKDKEGKNSNFRDALKANAPKWDENFVKVE